MYPAGKRKLKKNIRRMVTALQIMITVSAFTYMSFALFLFAIGIDL